MASASDGFAGRASITSRFCSPALDTSGDRKLALPPGGRLFDRGLRAASVPAAVPVLGNTAASVHVRGQETRPFEKCCRAIPT